MTDMQLAILVIGLLVLGGLIGFGIEKLGQFVYFKRVYSKGAAPRGLRKDYIQRNHIFKNEKVDTVFLGDSITELYPINEFYFNKPYVNRGIGGDVTVGVINRIYENVICLNPKRIMLMIGTNDLNDRTSIINIANNIREIISIIKTKLPATEIVVQSVYPVDEKMHISISRNNKNIKKLNEEIVKICKNTELQYVDTWKVLANEKGQLIRNYTYDGLHLSVEGYFALTNYLKANIKNL